VLQALVTGSGRMPEAIAARLESDGGSVTRWLDKGEDHDHGVDFADENSSARMIDTLPTHLDVLVLSHSHVERGTLGEITPSAWRRLVDYNLTSAFVIIRGVVPLLSPGGRIVIVSSVAGLDRSRNAGPHVTASKAGLNALVRHLSVELATRDVRINAVCAGLIDDEHAASVNTPETYAAAVEAVPMKRAGEPREIASAVAFLVSNESSFTTGALLTVAGGTHP
jgi:3-oxoacyl-[acyl-carrier protein] reductase